VGGGTSLFLTAVGFAEGEPAGGDKSAAAVQPNVVFILADDMGWRILAAMAARSTKRQTLIG